MDQEGAPAETDPPHAGLGARLAPSFWVVQLPDLVDGDRRLQQSERHQLALQVTVGLPRVALRALLGVLAATYLALAVPLALLCALLIGTSAPAWMLVLATTLASFTILQGLLSWVRFLLPLDPEAVVVWHPLVADLVVAVLAVALAVVIGS